MDDTTGTGTTATPTRPRRGRGMLWGLIAVVIAFSAGFIWQYYEASTVRDQLTATEHELALERLRIHLGQAALAAQSGDYEIARQRMSGFFDKLEDQPANLDPQIVAVTEDILEMRDEVITGLSRSNPEYADVVSGMYESLNNAVDRALGLSTEQSSIPGGAPAIEPAAEDTSRGTSTGDSAPAPGG